MGTIKTGINRNNEELISCVENPEERIVEALAIVREWRGSDPTASDYLESIVKTNSIICSNDLPEFYDPIEHEKY
jgi:hypothetical protein